MRVEVVDDAQEAASRTADLIAMAARDVVAVRGRFLLAVSGGRTPGPMLRALAAQPLPWDAVHVFQVDERVAPAGDPARNLTGLREALLDQAPIPAQNVHPMPVEDADLEEAAGAYAATLAHYAGQPPVLDVVHLGLGPDGHTASLVPGDAVLEIGDRDVAVTGIYQEHRRMTLTFPMLARARLRFWLVTGADKSRMLARLYAGDQAIPAGRLPSTGSCLCADRAAGARLRS